MRVLHVSYCYFPDVIGGTEIYVSSLTRVLQQLNVEVDIAAPAEASGQYIHEGQRVHRYEKSRRPIKLTDLYGEGCPFAARNFESLFHGLKPDLVHLHAFTSEVSLRLVRLVKQRRVPVVFTYHTPAVSCPRGTLLRWGDEICDGGLQHSPCTECVLHSFGMSRSASRTIRAASSAFGSIIARFELSGRHWTALRMDELLSLRRRAFLSFVGEVDHIVSVCDWGREILVRNRVETQKITTSRAGHFANRASRESTHAERNRGRPFRLAFVGRIHSTKGLEVLVEAILRDPHLPVVLDIFGMAQDSEGARIQWRIERRLSSACESRIQFRDPLPPDAVVTTLTEYDMLAVPSQWLETGPLVVYEAFAAGIPVIGSDLGGISELVRHEINGLLVSPHAVSDWTAALRRITFEPGLCSRLRSGIEQPRSMRDAAVDMLTIYQRLLHQAA